MNDRPPVFPAEALLAALELLLAELAALLAALAELAALELLLAGVVQPANPAAVAPAIAKPPSPIKLRLLRFCESSIFSFLSLSCHYMAISTANDPPFVTVASVQLAYVIVSVNGS